MKRKISLFAVLSLIAVMVLGMMGNQADAVSTTSSPTTLTFKGTITLWSDAPGFNSPKVENITTPVVFTPDTTDHNWSISIAQLSIPWSSSTTITLQSSKVASGSFNPSTNAVTLTLPLQGIPVLNAIEVSLTTDNSITTTTGQVIQGSRIDSHGNMTLVGSQSMHILFIKKHVQIRIQGALSPWPLHNALNPL